MEDIRRGIVREIFITSGSDTPMSSLQKVKAISGKGLEGDMHSNVSLINGRAFDGRGFIPRDSRRNIVVDGIELPELINTFFEVGDILMRGVRYCPIYGQSNFTDGGFNFRRELFERGGIIAEVWSDGYIQVGNFVAQIDRDEYFRKKAASKLPDVVPTAVSVRRSGSVEHVL